MRATRLAKVAIQAEGLRLRRRVRRTAFQAAYAVVGVVFLIALLSCLHAAAVIALAGYVAPVWAVLIVAGADLVVGGVFLLLASSSSPDAIELEALEVRKTAQAQMMQAAALTTLVGPALRLIGTRKTYGLALAALTARYLGGRSA